MSYFMRFPGGKGKTLTLSYDDGVESDIKLIDILDKHGIKATFNINSGLFGVGSDYHIRLTEEDSKKLYSNPNHEVAVHTLTHPYLEQLTPEVATYEVLQDRINLEKMFGKPIRGMAYPFGTYSDGVINVLKSCNIAYSRTTKNDMSFQLPTDWLELKSTCHHNNPQLMELCDKFLDPNLVKWVPKMFYLWGHSYEFLIDKNWYVIERFAEKMGGHDDIWYATNIEIHDYVQAFNSLQMTADNKVIYNPTVTELFMEADGEIYSIKSGETLKL